MVWYSKRKPQEDKALARSGGGRDPARPHGRTRARARRCGAGRGPRAGPPGRAACLPARAPARRRDSPEAGARSRREAAARPWPGGPAAQTVRAAEAARAGRGVAQEAGGAPVCAGGAGRPAEGGRPRGAGREAARRRPPPRRHSPAPPTSATSGSEGKMVAAPRGRAGEPRKGYARDAGVAAEASSSRPAWPPRTGAPAAPPSPAFGTAATPPLSAPAERASWGRCSGARTRPSAYGGSPAAGAQPRHVTTHYRSGQRRACAAGLGPPRARPARGPAGAARALSSAAR